MLTLHPGKARGGIVDSTTAGASKPQPLRARLERTLEQFLRAHRTFPGVAIAVRTPRLTLTGAGGVANLATRTP